MSSTTNSVYVVYLTIGNETVKAPFTDRDKASLVSLTLGELFFDESFDDSHSDENVIITEESADAWSTDYINDLDRMFDSSQSSLETEIETVYNNLFQKKLDEHNKNENGNVNGNVNDDKGKWYWSCICC